MCFQQHTLYYTEQIAAAENGKKNHLTINLFLHDSNCTFSIIIIKNYFDVIYPIKKKKNYSFSSNIIVYVELSHWILAIISYATEFFVNIQ